MVEKNEGINLSKIKYDENGLMIFDERENNNETTNEDIKNEENKDDEKNILDKNTTNKIDKTLDYDTPMTSEEKAMALSQTMEEIAEDMKQEKKRHKKNESAIYMNKRNTMFICCLVFTIMGLAVGTFITSDYITSTLIGLLLGILVGRFYCGKLPKDETLNNIKDENDK